jgi:hypothetical protein
MAWMHLITLHYMAPWGHHHGVAFVIADGGPWRLELLQVWGPTYKEHALAGMRVGALAPCVAVAAMVVGVCLSMAGNGWIATLQ